MEQGNFDFKAFQSEPWILCQLGRRLIAHPPELRDSFTRRLRLPFCSRSPTILGASLTPNDWQTTSSPALLRLAAASSVPLSSTTAGALFAFQSFLPAFLLPAASATFLAFSANCIDLVHISSIRLNAPENLVRMTAFFLICN